jgi:outer membrane protein OmpA-like peptidoglycan-associated protein
MAYDRDRHVRFVGSRNRHIRHFRIAAPEVEITNITFNYHPWITEDDFQGTLQFIVRNNGDGAAKNLSFTLSDSLVAATNGKSNGETTNKPLAEIVIPKLLAGGVDTLKLDWRTTHAGLHEMTAHLDAENRLRENDKMNNHRRAAFYTIPKGRFVTHDTVLVLKQARLAYEVPFIAEVCFDSSNAEVKPDYLKKAVLEPPLVTLSQRLRGNRDLKIYLQGFADPNSGENETTVADGRVAAVRDSLIALGVYAEQIQLLQSEVIAPRRPPRDPADFRWVMQERRFVNILADNSSEAVLFQLVAFNLNEPLPSPVIFNAAIAGAVPLQTGMIQLESGTLREQINVKEKFQGSNLEENIFWQPDQNSDKTGGTNGTKWVGHNAAYEIVLVDTLGRQFRTKPRETYLAAQSILREQRVAWPMKFRGTEPLYDFYWTNLMQHVNRMLEDKNMRMRFAGHACAIGPEPVNMKLSKQRAEAFREGFVQHIKAKYPESFEKIMQRLDPAVGYGETQPLTIEYLNGERVLIGDNEKPLGRKLNRRLEIEFYYPEATASRLGKTNRQLKK